MMRLKYKRVDDTRNTIVDALPHLQFQGRYKISFLNNLV